MARAIRIHEHGGPEVLRLEEVEPGAPARGQLRVRVTAIGVNFIDVYDRRGLYPVNLPSGLGREAAGVVVETGRGVRGFRAGDRVGWLAPRPGAYAEELLVDAAAAVPLPEGISDNVAAAALLKGLTAWCLLRECRRLRRGDPLVVHAAAGGVGLILVQWAKLLGGEVIAVVGSEAKAELVRAHGAAHVLVNPGDGLAAQVRELTGGRGVPVVYDGVGKDTFFASLDCLQRRGLMVSYGNASGVVPPFSPMELLRRGSLFLTRPTLFDYIARPADRKRGARELFAVLAGGAVKVLIGQSYALTEAARAHADLEARRTTGSTLLVP